MNVWHKVLKLLKAFSSDNFSNSVFWRIFFFLDEIVSLILQANGKAGLL